MSNTSLPISQNPALFFIRATPTAYICEKCGTIKSLRGSEDSYDRSIFIQKHRGCYLPRIKVSNINTESKEYQVGVDTIPDL